MAFHWTSENRFINIKQTINDDGNNNNNKRNTCERPAFQILPKSFGMWSDKVWIQTHMQPKHWQQKKTVRGSYKQQQM